MGNSQLPGTDSMTMLSILTPALVIESTQPLTNGLIQVSFHLA